MKSHNEDHYFKNIISKSNLELPFPDFEETLMMEINKLEVTREAYTASVKKSWVSFITGAIFGVILSLLLPQILPSFYGISADSLVLAFQFMISLFVLISLDSLIRNTRDYMRDV